MEIYIAYKYLAFSSGNCRRTSVNLSVPTYEISIRKNAYRQGKKTNSELIFSKADVRKSILGFRNRPGMDVRFEKENYLLLPDRMF